MNLPLRANILAMRPYVPGKPIEEVKRELGLTQVVKLASNENPYGPSPLALTAVREAAEQMHMYPDGSAFELKQKLSQVFNISPDWLIVGNGSDEIIHLLAHLLLNQPDEEVIVGVPGFTRYHAAAFVAPARLVSIPLRSDYRHDLDAMAGAITPNTRLIYLDNPNNPIGSYVDRFSFERFLDQVPETVLVVLDEAYYEFAYDREDYPDALTYVKQGRNVIGLRTMSKAFGLAGLRVGYAFCDPAITDSADRAREPFNVNSLAMVAAIAALDDHEHVQRTVVNNRLGLDRLVAFFRQRGATPVEGCANFVYVDLGIPARPVYEALLREGVIVRPGDLLGNPNALRISIGTPAEMDRFVAAFDAVAPALATN